jgi:hypothetical protein
MAHARGFHLIELIVVLAVMTTAVAIVVSRMGDGQNTYKLNLATKQIIQDIESARESARYESRPKSISFYPDVSSYLMWAGSSQDLQSYSQTEPVVGEDQVEGNELIGVAIDAIAVPVYELIDPHQIISRVESQGTAVRVGYSETDAPIARQVMLNRSPFNARVLAADFAGAGTLTFNGYGIPVDAGTVLVEVGRRANLISVDSLSGSVGSAAMTSAALVGYLDSYEIMLQSVPEREATSLIATGESLSYTVGAVTGTVVSTGDELGDVIETVGGGSLSGIDGLLGGGG